MTYYTVFLIELHSRRVHVAGSTRHPDEAFVLQAMRDLTNGIDRVLVLAEGFVLICDRDRTWGRAVLEFLDAERVWIIRTPFRAPNGNVYAERFVRQQGGRAAFGARLVMLRRTQEGIGLPAAWGGMILFAEDRRAFGSGMLSTAVQNTVQFRGCTASKAAQGSVRFSAANSILLWPMRERSIAEIGLSSEKRI